MYRLAILFTLAGILATPMAYAQHPNAKVALHVQDHLAKGDPCVGQFTPAPCNTFVNTGSLNTAYDVYVVVAQGTPGTGLAGVTMGIAYDGSTTATGSGVWSGGWTLCADLEFPQADWGESGWGNVVTFDATTNCQNSDPGDGTQAMVGVFYLYAYDTGEFAVIEHPAFNQIAVADCTADENQISAESGGIVGFGGNLGCNPCQASCVPTPVEEETWGGIKTQFKGEE